MQVEVVVVVVDGVREEKEVDSKDEKVEGEGGRMAGTGRPLPLSKSVDM